MLASDDKQEIVGSVLHLTITGLVAIFLSISFLSVSFLLVSFFYSKSDDLS